MGDPSLVVIELQALSEAFRRKVGSRQVLSTDFKPNIYHEVQDWTLMAPGRSPAAALVRPTSGTMKRKGRGRARAFQRQHAAQHDEKATRAA